MTPACERLVRLALGMPEEAVEVIAKTAVWICPGLENASGPACIHAKADLFPGLTELAADPELQRLAFKEIASLSRPARRS